MGTKSTLPPALVTAASPSSADTRGRGCTADHGGDQHGAIRAATGVDDADTVVGGYADRRPTETSSSSNEGTPDGPQACGAIRAFSPVATLL